MLLVVRSFLVYIRSACALQQVLVATGFEFLKDEVAGVTVRELRRDALYLAASLPLSELPGSMAAALAATYFRCTKYLLLISAISDSEIIV